jgi:outer membrane protein TolC
MMSLSRNLAVLCLLAILPLVTAAQKSFTLPEPLTLPQALELASRFHPDVRKGQLAIDSARADRDAVKADSGFGVSLKGRVRWVEPSSVSPYQDNDDHHAGLFVSTRLYDFGRTRHNLAAADSGLKGARWLFRDVMALRRIAIMEAYFNVILADLAYVRDNEAMATAFVSFDRAKDRNKLGQVSDIELAKAENRYQAARRVRYASDVRRRAMRQRLANLLNYPKQLSSNLANPRLAMLKRKLPDVDKLKKLALQNNPRLRGLRLQVEAARQRVLAARAGSRPIIRGQLEASSYTRDLGSRDRYRAGITFEVPIFTNGRVKALVAQRRADLGKVQAEYRAMQLRLHQEIIETWNAIYVLKAQIQEMLSLIEYRDLYLDRSRALYEMDARTTLGDAMVKFSGARFKMARTRFQLALMWARLDALLGKPVYPAKAVSGGK